MNNIYIVKEIIVADSGNSYETHPFLTFADAHACFKTLSNKDRRLTERNRSMAMVITDTTYKRFSISELDDTSYDVSISKYFLLDDKYIEVDLSDEQKSNNYPVVTLCGSTKFKDEFIKVQKDLALKGNIVISLAMFGHTDSPEAFTSDTLNMLSDMHKQKIDMSDYIFVINKDGYIGESTRNEIEYAKSLNKPIQYLEPYIDNETIQLMENTMFGNRKEVQ